MEPIAAFIFHRDLRLIDNKALEACKGANVIPMFIFTPEQVTNNKYKSINAIQFMLESLEYLDAELHKRGSRLHCFYGKTEDILRSLPPSVTVVADNIDYTPYARKRSAKISNVCKETGRKYIQEHDIYLHPPGSILTKSGTTYQKFTPFYEESLKHKVDTPLTVCGVKFIRRNLSEMVTLKEMWSRLVPKPNPRLHVHGGRAAALTLLDTLPRDYERAKDNPMMSTSNLSAHNHFGTVSIREVYAAAQKRHMGEYIRQLYWRDFYGHIVSAYEDLYGISPYDVTSKRKWKDDPVALKAFKDGKTGVDIVDAGIKQLKETGYIPNRVRLIVGSYLVNELGLSWKEGELFFSKHLVDIDYAQNVGNWTWLDGTAAYGQNAERRLSVKVQDDKYKQYSYVWLTSGLTSHTQLS